VKKEEMEQSKARERKNKRMGENDSKKAAYVWCKCRCYECYGRRSVNHCGAIYVMRINYLMAAMKERVNYVKIDACD
jgi:hypothetical protein